MNSLGRLISTRWQRVKSEPGLKRNVVVVIALIALATITGGIILGNQRFTVPWADKYVVNAAFEGTPGISPGNGQEVRIAGVMVGQIAEASVGERGEAVLRLELEPGYRLYDNARLVLRPKSPLNEMYVTVDPGGPPGQPVPSGGSLPTANSERPVQVDEVLGHLDEHTRQRLTELLSESDVALASAPEELPKGLDSTSRLARDLRPVLEQLEQRRDKLQRLVTAVSQVSHSVGHDDRRLAELAGSLQETLGVVGRQNQSVDSVLAQLPALTRELQNATEAVQVLSGELDPALRNLHEASGTLPPALSRVTDTAEQLDRTVDRARPLVAAAKPVVADLRPFVAELNVALPELKRSSARLDPVTATLTNYLPDLGAFFVNTRSLTSMRDGNGGILRGMLEITSTSPPTDALAPLSPGEVEGPLGPDDGRRAPLLPPGASPKPGLGILPAPPTDN